ncbi:sedoheptulose 7-phosphate cyclase [Alphaproteobacteria bacterium]|nr:sedoheptulose 7-phosphate cyclase [Alphaproteobacteria bacterium]
MSKLVEFKINVNKNIIESLSKIEFSYNIYFPDNIFDIKNSNIHLFGNSDKDSRRLLFIDDSIDLSIENSFKKYFLEKKIDLKIARIFCLESNKNTEMLFNILSIIESFGIKRRGEPILILGGGVLMDVVAFACSIYRRGVPYVKIPTTLLGLVDASIGIKTSINHFSRRNRIGSYSFPTAVVIEPSFMSTLPIKEFSNGLSEIIKLAIIKDAELFQQLESNAKKLLDYNFFKSNEGKKIILKAINGMMEELVSNPFEINLKRVADFGHTFSPVPEMRSFDDSDVDDLSHGTAVALDCLLSCAISHKRKFLSIENLTRIIDLLKKCKIPIRHPYYANPDLLWESSQDAIRHRDGNLNLPLPNDIGSAFFCNDLTFFELKESIKLLEEINA